LELFNQSVGGVCVDLTRNGFDWVILFLEGLQKIARFPTDHMGNFMNLPRHVGIVGDAGWRFRCRE